LIPDKGNLPNSIKYAEINPSIGIYHGLVYSEEQQFAEIKNYLQSHKINLREFPTFYLGTLDIWPPPYNLSNGDAISIIKRVNLEAEFTEYLKSRPPSLMVTFSRVINERVLVFGWWHKAAERKIRRRGGRFLEWERPISPKEYHRLLAKENASLQVMRFSPQVYSRQRLTERTSADYDQHEHKGVKSVLIAGLGSIGSNLIPLLEKTRISEYKLVDKDILTLDNLGRHFLGINDVGKNKTVALREYLEQKNPLLRVYTREKRIVPLIEEEPKFLSSCECYFFCTGDINSEMWLAQTINQSEWNRPAFFIWVEPYLAGGHCVYYNGIDPIAWEDLFPNRRFVYNIISKESHDQVVFTKREAGCQITYVPYSTSNLQLFITALFPKILDLLKGRGSNISFSWTGDLSIVKKMKIGLSQYADDVQSFSLIERSL
jgi:hypothetical protein